MKYLIVICLLLTGCSIEQPLPNNPYQVRAGILIAEYNSAHHLNLPVPRVNIGPTTELSYANDWCPNIGCFITLNSVYVAQNPDYIMSNTLPHELAHHICVLTIPGCKADNHGKEWQKIALELGLSKDDGYINP